MAQIPLGNFDSVQVQAPVRTGAPDNSGALAKGRAAEGLGQTVAEFGLRGNAQLQQQRQAENDALVRAKAANALSDYELQLGAAQEDYANRMQSGMVDFDKAGAGWEETVAKLPPVQAPTGMDPALTERFNGAIRQTQERAKLKVAGVAEVAKRADLQKTAAEALDKNEQVAAMPGQSAEEAVARNQGMLPLLRAAGFDEAKASDIVHRSNERIWTNEAKGRINAADDSIEALQAINQELTGDKGRYLDKLDPGQRIALSATVKNRIDQLQQRDLAVADKREAQAGQAISAMNDQAVSGLPPKTDDLLKWQEAVQGTSQVDAYNDALQTMQDVQDVLRKPPAEQDAYLQGIQTRMMAQGASVKDQARYNTLSAAVERNKKMMTEQPLLYLQARNGIPATPIDFQAMAQSGDFSAFGQAIESRMATLQAGRARYGAQIKMSPLLPQEQQMLAAAMDAMPPQKLNGLFGVLRQSAGSDEAFNAVMQQVAPNAPLKARAGQLAIRGERGQKVSSLILSGEALLNPKDGSAKWKMPPDKGFKEVFDDTVGGAYQGRPQDYQRDFQAVRAVYAGAAARDGNSDASNEIDPRLLADSIRAVAGEPSTEFGRVPVLPPWGMSPDDFDDRAKPLFDKALQAAGYQDFSGIHLVGTPREGVYMLAQGITALFDPNRKTRDGKPAPLFIDLNTAPTVPGANKPKDVTVDPRKVYEATVRGAR